MIYTICNRTSYYSLELVLTMLSYKYLMIGFERYPSHFASCTSKQYSGSLLLIPDVDYRFRDFNDAGSLESKPLRNIEQLRQSAID